jgi:hypothetical protein
VGGGREREKKKKKRKKRRKQLRNFDAYQISPINFLVYLGGHLICVKNPLRKDLTPTPLVG